MLRGASACAQPGWGVLPIKVNLSTQGLVKGRRWEKPCSPSVCGDGAPARRLGSYGDGCGHAKPQPGAAWQFAAESICKSPLTDLLLLLVELGQCSLISKPSPEVGGESQGTL